MKMFFAFIIAVTFTRTAWSQPVEGPYIVQHADSGSYGAFKLVMSDNNTANIFYGYHAPDTSDYAYAQNYFLPVHSPNGAPQVLAELHGWSATIEGAAVNSEGRWYCAVTATEQSCDACRVRTYMNTVTNNGPLSGLVYVGTRNPTQPAESYLLNDRLIPSPSRGVILLADKENGWAGHWVRHPYLMYFGNASVTPESSYEYSATDSATDYTVGGVICTVDSRLFLTLNHDAVQVATTLPPFVGDPPPDTVNCMFSDRTAGGRLIHMSFREMAGGLPYIRIDEYAENGDCSTLLDTTTRFNYVYSVFNPNYGWAVFAEEYDQFIVARIDTNGVFTQPEGTLFQTDLLHGITTYHAAITDQGRIVVAWTEHSLGDYWSPTDLKICWVEWSALLATSESEIAQAPSSYTLSAYPNPFNPSASLSFSLPQSGQVSLRIFDILGREVSVLQNGFLPAGDHHLTLDGSRLSSGIYFARLETNQTTLTRKLTLLK